MLRTKKSKFRCWTTTLRDGRAQQKRSRGGLEIFPSLPTILIRKALIILENGTGVSLNEPRFYTTSLHSVAISVGGGAQARYTLKYQLLG